MFKAPFQGNIVIFPLGLLECPPAIVIGVIGIYHLHHPASGIHPDRGMAVIGKPDTDFIPFSIQDIGIVQEAAVRVEITQLANFFIDILFRLYFKPDPVIEPIGGIDPDNGIGETGTAAIIIIIGLGLCCSFV